ncbi:hypothetical protein AJ79_07456 [Helicocarpus griseus UAMH5409]|uniref:Putative zinc-finger domain-containing protein n=1 Tax=Helicocarpus griseus UAMH5409 TaxID=1447875 RepID=A0A2B7X2L5_9EURO|nr:hypothetical protein AJ79_07456 [Helicocarpus griseus UAMH5409]
MSSNHPPTPSFGGYYNPSQQWPPEPSSASSGEASDGYQPRPPIPPPPQAFAINGSGFTSNPQIPGLAANNSAPFLLDPSFPFMPPFQHPSFQHPSFQQPGPYPPTFTPPMVFPRQPAVPQREPNGEAQEVQQTVPTDTTKKESDNAAGLDAIESPEPMDLGDREEGELSNGEIEEMESSELEGYPNYQPKDHTSDSYTQSYGADKKHKRRSDVDSQGICGRPSSYQLPADPPAEPLSHYKSGKAEQPRKPVRNPENAGLFQPPEAGGKGTGYSDQDSKPANRGINAPPTFGINAHDEPVSRDANNSAVSQTLTSGNKTQTNANGVRPYTSHGKSPAQLRVQAQGALLGLAPHNIKFDELVKEGIDPVILKRLYDEIGLKITSTHAKDQKAGKQPATSTHAKDPATTSLTTPAVSAAEPITTQASSSAHPAVAPSQSSESVKEAVNKPARPPTQETTGVPAANSSKPLERKDVIARMLAAKAGKGSTEPVRIETTKESVPQNMSTIPVSSDEIPKATDMLASQSPQQTANETRAKEKNKAQTELARQRMEQLKKQGLMRSQTRSAAETPVVTQSLSAGASTAQHPQHATEPSASQPPSSLSHPLPSRPPEPEPQSTARIPGLFMTSSEPAKTEEPTISKGDSILSTESSLTKIRAPRKRPRASDFTDEPNTAPQKRQAGHEVTPAIPDHKVIIDISEDEFMYGSDIDAAEAKQSAPEPGIAGSDRNLASSQPLTKELPPLSDFSSRNYSLRSTPAVSVSQTPGAGNQQGDLQMEILAMRQKIAELEKRKAEKLNANRVESPELRDRSSIGSTAENGLAVNGQAKTEHPKPRSHQPGNSPVVVSSPERIINPALQSSQNSGGAVRSQSILSQTSLDPSQIESMRKKFMRKREIESGLPMLEAELQKSEARLLQFREEEQRLLAEIEKGKAGRRRLVEELESLGVETVGLSIEELQATKDALEEVGETVNANQASPQPASKGTPTDSPSDREDIARSGLVQDHGPVPIQTPTEMSTVSQRFEAVPKTSQEAIEMGMPVSTKDTEEVVSGADVEDDGSTCSSSAMDESMGSSQDVSDQEEMQQESDASAEQAQSRSPRLIIDAGMADLDEQPSEMSESVSPTPLEDKSTLSMPKPDDTGDRASYPESSVGSDAYEPPEPDFAPENSGPIESPPFSPASPDRTEPADGDPYSPRLARDVTALTLDPQDAMAEASIDSSKGKDDSSRVNRYFTPYNSPLRLFKAYRYHPRYTEDVNGGYRSLTYSHNIDPQSYVCPYEATGGACNDHSCEYQHFRDMTLSDDKILVEMGSVREGKTPEEREEYVAGLRQTVNDMRRDKVKDLNTVATEIAGYRRRFLKDPSRVLAL